MSDIVEFLTDCGRLVQGSLYDPKTEDAEGNTLTIKKGANAGQQRYDYFFSIAIPKKTAHWKDTKWGELIWNVGQQAFPKGQANSSGFFWKITDGDSDIPNGNEIPPSSRPGFKGCWVIRFKSCFAPQIWNPRTKTYITEKNFINLGDYIQVFGFVLGNKSTQSPGVFINPRYIAFQGYGERILLGKNINEVEFDTGVPEQASLTPLNMEVHEMPQVISESTVDIKPYPQILEIPTPPTPPLSVQKPIKQLTEKANGASYESLIALGWTDKSLIEYGLMLG